MMRSLFSGVSGLKVHQTKMDVIGNNISNVNTIGFKASSVTFSDVFYQTTQHASGPNDTTGMSGKNAMQIGLGSNLASITTNVSVSGAAQRTDNPLDVMIEGDGFFIVNYGGTNYFTKAGSFDIDAAGNLHTPAGAIVMGWLVDEKDPTKIVADTVKPLQVMSADKLYSKPEATTAAYVSGNIDKKDTQVAANATGKLVNLSFYDQLGYGYTAQFRVRQENETTTNVYDVDVMDITDSTGQSIFVNKVTKDGKTTYEKSSITKVTLGGATYEVDTVDADTGKVTLKMSTGNKVKLTFDAATGEFVNVGTTTGTGTGTTGNKTIDFVVNADGGGGTNPFKTINIDFSTTTMYSNSTKSSLEAHAGTLDGKNAGKKVGNLNGITIDASGKIYGKYDNGDNILLAQIALATFANPAGLEAIGNNMFAATANSGDFDGIGKDPTEGGGSLTTGVVEMSNVDLAAQFTEMITTQRGFQANSRIITTSDSLLEELINLKR